jgi:protein TonB
MKAENILQTDLLDILFEDRNRSYGAYPLRKYYHQRLYLAVGLVTGAVLLFMVWMQFWRPATGDALAQVIWQIDSVKLVHLPPETPKTKPAEVLPKVQKAQTVQHVTPRIVKDHLATDTMPSQQVLSQARIGTTTVDGPAATSDGPTSNQTGTSTLPSPPVEPPVEPAVWEQVEVMPSYPGGMEAFRRFLARHLRAPESELAPGDRVRVPVRFIIDASGAWQSLSFPPETAPAFQAEIERVMRKMPNWVPGTQQGRKVAVYYTIPIVFELPAED